MEATPRTENATAGAFGDIVAAAAARCLAANPEVAAGRIFSSAGLNVRGKYFAVPRPNDLLLKLPATRVQQLIESGAGQAFTSGGRTMKEWVLVQPADEASCAAYMDEARVFVASTVR
jgi:hypothetical protein